MKQRKLLTVLFFTLVCSLFSPFGQVKAESDPVPPIDVPSAVVMNITNGDVLVDVNSDQVFPTASLTKIMTGHLFSDYLKETKTPLSTNVTITEEAWRTEGNRMWIEVGKQVSLENLAKGVLMSSSNDASTQIASVVSGSTDAFVDKMNEEAKKLGLTNTHFSTPHGMIVNGVSDTSTAKDMAKLASYYAKNVDPTLLSYGSLEEFSFDNSRNEIQLLNANSLYGKIKGLVGLQSGYVKDKKHSTYNSAVLVKRGQTMMLGVIMGAKSSSVRDNNMQKLLSYAFNQYQEVTFEDTEETQTKLSVFLAKSHKKAVIHQQKPLTVTVLKRDVEKLVWDKKHKPYVLGGSKKGDNIGKGLVQLNGKTLASSPLLLTEDIERSGPIGTFFDSFALLFYKLIIKIF